MYASCAVSYIAEASVQSHAIVYRSACTGMRRRIENTDMDISIAYEDNMYNPLPGFFRYCTQDTIYHWGKSKPIKRLINLCIGCMV